MRIFGGRHRDPLDDADMQAHAVALIGIDKWIAMRDYLEQHPVLVSPRGPHALSVYADVFEQQGRHVATRALRQLAPLLVRCGEIGVAAAIDETQRRLPGPGPVRDEQMLRLMATLVFEPTWTTKRRLLDEHPGLYGEAGLELLQDMHARALDDPSDSGMADRIGLHIALLSRCRAAGVSTAYDELRRAIES